MIWVQETGRSSRPTRTIMWRQKRCLLRKARIYRAFLLPKGKQTRMKAKWGLFMTEQKKNTIITSGIAVLAVILAYCFRIVGRGSFYPMLFSYLRSFIYISLFAAWGLSVRQRIVQKQVCRFMTVTAVLLIIWMVVRSAKYFIFWQPDAVRYLWYLFYLPMLFVPMLALLIAMSLGKPDEYKFPKGMSILPNRKPVTVPSE